MRRSLLFWAASCLVPALHAGVLTWTYNGPNFQFFSNYDGNNPFTTSMNIHGWISIDTSGFASTTAGTFDVGADGIWWDGNGPHLASPVLDYWFSDGFYVYTPQTAILEEVGFVYNFNNPGNPNSLMRTWNIAFYGSGGHSMCMGTFAPTSGTYGGLPFKAGGCYVPMGSSAVNNYGIGNLQGLPHLNLDGSDSTIVDLAEVPGGDIAEAVPVNLRSASNQYWSYSFATPEPSSFSLLLGGILVSAPLLLRRGSR